MLLFVALFLIGDGIADANTVDANPADAYIADAPSPGAQSAHYAEMYRITVIYITGLRRTRFSTAERPLRRFIGMEADQVDRDDVFAAIMAAGNLEPLYVEIEGQVLAVTVREQWSVFPVPVLMGGTGGLMGGLAFFDANAFGLNDQFFLAGMYHPDGWIATVGYNSSSRGGRLPGWNGFFLFSREERHDRCQNNELLRRFELDTIFVNAGLNIPLLPDSDLLSVSAQFAFSDRRLPNPGSARNVNAPYTDHLRMFGLGGDFTIRRSNWDGYFLSQEAASIRYFFNTEFGGISFHSVQLRANWERSIVPGFRFMLRSGITFQPNVPVFFESPPGTAQVAILPRDFSARNYAGLSAGLERSIIRINAGTFSISASYQVVYSYGSILGNSVDHGVLGMFTFYLNRVAIPALSLGVAYNVNRNYFQGFFGLGMTF